MSGHTSSDASTSFEWDEYLVKTNGKPADPKCFKQSIIPPENHFEVNTLLEAEDQRSAALDVQTAPSFTIDPSKSRSSLINSVAVGLGGISAGNANRRSSLLNSHHPVGTLRRFRAAAFSLARVVEVWGARVRIRLVGTDDRNDCWFLVDSDQIRPYPSGNPLQPPFGYMHNHLVWNRTLKKATEGAKFAETSWFVQPPPDPADNFFQTGDKLEAVDRRNTQLICPATVGAVNGQYILVSFDGWSGAFDYWTRFDSRELFPVGWCKLADYPLQPPGPNALRSPPTHSTPGPLSKNVLALRLDPSNAFQLDVSSVGSTPSKLQKSRSKVRVRTAKRTVNATRSISHTRSRFPRLTRKRRRKPHALHNQTASHSVHMDLSHPLALTIPTGWRLDGSSLVNKIGSDTSHPFSESVDSSIRSIGSPPPPVIHPVTMEDEYVDRDSLLNVTTGSSSSDPPPPSIEAAVPVGSNNHSLPIHEPDLSSVSSVSHGRRTSSSSDCVVRLQAKSPPNLAPGSASDLAANHPELKSWQVVTTAPRSKTKKKSKLEKKHRSSTENSEATNGLKKKLKLISDNSDPSSSSSSNYSRPASDRKSDSSPISLVDRSLKAGQLAVDTNEHTMTGRRSLTVDTRDLNFHAPAGATHDYAHDYYSLSHHDTNLRPVNPLPSCTSASSLDFAPVGDSVSDKKIVSASTVSQPGPGNVTTHIPGSNWYTSSKLENENYSGNHTSDDYTDSQSIAPHISSSTVSPSSLDLGPCPLPNPSLWSIDDVYHYIATRDSSLLEVAQKFKHHEIDGQALLLLTMEALRNYLKIKLGPALKVDHLISRLKRGVF